MLFKKISSNDSPMSIKISYLKTPLKPQIKKYDPG